MQKTTPWQMTFGALIAVSACAALSAALVGNLTARILFAQETTATDVKPPEVTPVMEEQEKPLDTRWQSDLLRSLDDQLRNMKDLERNANQSKDVALLQEIQNFRTSVDGHKNCVQSASTQEALQTCNEAMQSTWDASSKLWTRNDIANRQRELKDMERQIKDAEREKTDVSKAKSILEQLRTALGNIQNLLGSGADNRDVQDAMQESVQPLQQQFYDTINATRRQGEAARFRSGQLKDMEREITNIERGKGDATKLKEIVERVKTALSAAEQLLLSGTTDNRDIDDAFRTVYDTAQEFQSIQNAAGRTRELKDRERDLKNMEKELQRAKKQKGTDTQGLQQAFEEYQSRIAELKKLMESGADPQTINDAFQSFYEDNPNQKFWDIQNAANRGKELQDRERDLKNMEKELQRAKKQKGANVQTLQETFDTYKSALAELRKLVESGADPETINDAFQDFYEQNHQQKFGDVQNATNRGQELKDREKDIKNMEREVKRMGKQKGVNVQELQGMLDTYKSEITELKRLSENGADPETINEAFQDFYERNTNDQFWGMVNAFNMKNELRQWTRKGGHLAKMQKMVDALRKKGKDVGTPESVLQQIKEVIANLESSTDRETLDEGRQELDDLRMQFEEALRPYMKKKMKGFPFPMKKG